MKVMCVFMCDGCIYEALANQGGAAPNQPVVSLPSVAKLDFVLTVLKPEAEEDPPDQLFLLSPAVLQKDNIQVNV